MNQFEKNVKNIWGDAGEQWLSQLPSIVDALSRRWSLTDITPIDHMSYNYIALACQDNKIPVVLKISCDQQALLNEYRALKHFDGHASIKVFRHRSNL